MHRKVIILLTFIAIVFIGIGYANVVMAKLTAEEVAQLDSDKLTIFGAERTGNADGTIPPYTGGYTKKIPNYDLYKDGKYPDPFAADKVLFSIDAKNMEKYKDKLTAATIAMMKKYKDFRIDVYPTHRPVSYPKYVIDGTKKAALTATLENDGLKLTNARLGVPFPMPKTGLEALWNFLARYSAPGEKVNYYAWIVDASGRLTNTTVGLAFAESPYWDPDFPADKDPEYVWKLIDTVQAPPNRKGEDLLWLWKIDKTQGDPAWKYLPGQRRVKKAPDISFDGPNTTIAGAMTYDDTFVYTGSPVRYDWKLLGKKEMYVPYNANKYVHWTKAADAFGPNFIKPEVLRWELHRVWVVEGTLKEGMRHIYGKRVFYLDEDTWLCPAGDSYDNNNAIYRGIFSTLIFNYNEKMPFPYAMSYFSYDLISGITSANGALANGWGSCLMKPLPERRWAPAALSGRGIR